jgi:hypothetical protein
LSYTFAAAAAVGLDQPRVHRRRDVVDPRQRARGLGPRRRAPRHLLGAVLAAVLGPGRRRGLDQLQRIGRGDRPPQLAGPDPRQRPRVVQVAGVGGQQRLVVLACGAGQQRVDRPAPDRAGE